MKLEKKILKVSTLGPAIVDMSLAEIMKGVVPSMLAADNAEAAFGKP